MLCSLKGRPWVEPQTCSRRSFSVQNTVPPHLALLLGMRRSPREKGEQGLGWEGRTCEFLLRLEVYLRPWLHGATLAGRHKDTGALTGYSPACDLDL